MTVFSAGTVRDWQFGESVTPIGEGCGMCLRCEGFTEEQLERSLDLTIMVHGYLIQQVRNRGGPDWTYTIGLSETWGHAELLCLQIEPKTQDNLVWHIGGMIAADGEIDHESLATDDVELVPVHPNHLAGDLVGTWCDRYDRWPEAGEFLQIVPGPSWFCSCHGGSVSRLDDTAPFTMPTTNRAQRRAGQRGKRRKGR